MKRALCVLFTFLFVLSFAGCSKGGNPNADLPAVMKDIKSQVEMTDVMELGKEDLKANYGIEEADVKQFAALSDTTGIKADEIVMIEGKDEAAAGRIKKALDERFEKKKNENKDYLPEQYAIIIKCKVNQKGNYVSMLVSPQAQKVEQIYDSKVK